MRCVCVRVAFDADLLGLRSAHSARTTTATVALWRVLSSGAAPPLAASPGGGAHTRG